MPRGAAALAAALVAALLVTSLCDPGAKDWIDSPFVGQGLPPPDGVDVYLSFYVDRIISINEQDYKFSANTFWLLSWTDERAPAAVEAATSAAAAPGASCARLCNQQRAASAVSKCCDAPLWLPSIVFRNVDEFPQGRVQPSYVDVSPAGVVTWRVEIRADFLTTLDVSAFPFDTQSLDIVATLSNYPGMGSVTLIPSAAGLALWTQGAGDDLSGFHAHDVHMFVRTPASYGAVFSSAAVVRRQVSASAPGDPAPLVPNNSPSALKARGGAPAPPRFGDDMGVVDLTVSIGVTRLWSYFALNAILPVVICTSISFLAFWVHPADLSTRLSLVVGLFLALVAIQYVIEGDLPRASYVLPTRRLVIASYVALALIAIETLIVANVVDWPRVRAYFHGQSRALARRAELKRAAMDWERSNRPPPRRAASVLSGSVAERGWGAALNRLATLARSGGSGAGLSARGGGAGGGRSGGSTAVASPRAAAVRAPSSPPPSSPPPRPSTAGLSAAEAQPLAKTVQFPDAADGAAVAGGGDVPPARRSPPPSRWPLSGGGGGGGAGASGAFTSSQADSGGRRASEAVLLEADMEAGYFAWLAWVIDMASFVTICLLYYLTAVLIFVIAKAREPDLCARSGVDMCLGASTKHGGAAGMGG